jgi:superoxide dismutase
VITRALEEKEVAHQGLTAMTVVETMHERKAAMAIWNVVNWDDVAARLAACRAPATG